MAAFQRALVVLVCLWEVCLSTSYRHETRRRNSKSTKFEYLSNEASKTCRSDADCSGGEYCHTFHRLCLKPRETVTVAPVKTSAKECSKTSDCEKKEYCHDFWKICLPSPKVYQQPRAKRPSGYCRTSKDCKIDEQCHKIFRTCYTSPGVSTVRRDTGNSRRCDKSSDCGANYYCHDHFRICLEDKTTVIKSAAKTTNQISCDINNPCPKGKLCHDFWKICYTPAQNVTLPKTKGNKTQLCLIDSDCKTDEVCHTVTAQSSHVLARQRRNVQRMCIPRSSRQPQTSSVHTTCKNDADCGPNKCCLGNLGICMAYKLPGEMCLTAKTDFVCPCVSGSYCKTRGKWASPRRIINKMSLPQTAASHLMSISNKKKYGVGKCTPSSL